MLPKLHFLLSLSLIFLILSLFPSIKFFYLLIILVSSVLLDIDHLFYYLYKNKKNLTINSFKEAYKWYKKDSKFFEKLPRSKIKKYYFGFYIFHSIEFIIFTFILSFFNKFFLFLFIGLFFHYLIDLIYDLYKDWPLQKFSLIYSFKERKKKNCFSIKGLS